MVINVKMVLSLLEKFNQAPKIAFREVGEPEDQKQGGQGEGGEEDQHDLHTEDHNRAQEDVAEYPQRTEVQDGDLRGLRLETLNKKLLGKTNHSSPAAGRTLPIFFQEDH